MAEGCLEVDKLTHASSGKGDAREARDTQQNKRTTQTNKTTEGQLSWIAKCNVWGFVKGDR